MLAGACRRGAISEQFSQNNNIFLIAELMLELGVPNLSLVGPEL